MTYNDDPEDDDGAPEPVTTRVFLLDPEGKAYQAAMALHVAVRTAIAEKPFDWGPEKSRSLNYIRDYWQGLYGRLYSKLKQENRDLLAATGLLAPATQVTVFSEGYPRAYEDYPIIFMHEYRTRENKFAEWEEKTDLYLYAPVDYHGQYFTPEDAVELDAKEQERVGKFLFGEGWIDPVPVLHMPRRGVATPPDFDPAIHQAHKGTYFANQTSVCFVAQGRSLDLVEDFRRRDDAWRSACNAVLDELKRIINEELGEEIREELPEGETFYINSGYAYIGRKKPEFEISVRKKGNIDIMEAGQPLGIPANRFFHKRNKYGGDYYITPRADTPEGLKLRELFDAVPATPSLADYPELLGSFTVTTRIPALAEAGTIPRLQDFDNKTLLVYRADKNHSSTFCPPDATPLSNALYTWLDKDQGDRNMGIVPPPMPEALRPEYAAYRKISLNDVLRRLKGPEPG